MIAVTKTRKQLLSEGYTQNSISLYKNNYQIEIQKTSSRLEVTNILYPEEIEDALFLAGPMSVASFGYEHVLYFTHLENYYPLPPQALPHIKRHNFRYDLKQLLL